VKSEAEQVQDVLLGIVHCRIGHIPGTKACPTYCGLESWAPENEDRVWVEVEDIMRCPVCREAVSR
jgi:hypothetical protein